MSVPLARAMHAALLARFGGLAGRVDEAKLESALARAPQRMAYGTEEPTVFELAAESAFGIARYHPCSDGNKRLALAVADMTLWLNGFQLTAPQAETVVVIQALAAGELEVAGWAAWLEHHAERTKRRR